MAKKKSTQAGWEFYHFDPVAMDQRLNTNAFQQVGNQVLKDEIKRGKRKK
jgi:hypothetical protein